MALTKRTLISCLALAAAASAWLVRRPPPQTVAEAIPSVPVAGSSDTEASTRDAPTSTDVGTALTRVFGGAVTALGPDPAIREADFNGDGSPDLAVNVRAPAPRLADVNDELANWMVQDVRPHAPSSAHARSRIVPEERLLAVIHGDGQRGWRSGEARQAFLLRNAPAVDELQARIASFSAPRPAGARGRGDVLVARGDKTETLLFFTGARYSMSP